MSEKLTVYILHGWSIHSENKKKWLNFLDHLKKNSIKSVFLTIPGLSAPLNEVWTLDDFVLWLGEQLPQNTRVILLGHSFGGQIAVRFAALNPDRVEKLILVDSAGIRDHDVIPTIKRKVFLLTAKVGKLLFPLPILKTLLYKLAREKDYHAAPPLLKHTMSAILDQEITTDLPRVTAQTLIIWGEKDAVTPIKLAAIFKEKIPDSTLMIIPEARHSPQFTNPKDTASLVSRFVKGMLYE